MDSNHGLWEHLIETVLALYVKNTMILFVGVLALSSLIGISSAWFITSYAFPCRNFLEWALILPLACPAYIVAYVYTDFLEYAGPIQGLIRAIFDFETAKDYYFPEIRSIGGAIVVMSFVLYPYVYILAKTGFNSTPRSLYETASLYGKNRFFRVGIPLCRPYIAAGLALVGMEVLSDFGTVEYFSIQTLTLGIFNVWIGMNSIAAASQIALITFLFIVLLLFFEVRARSQQRFNETTKRFNRNTFKPLGNFIGLLVMLSCFLPIVIGFVIPLTILCSNIFIGAPVFDLYNIGKVLSSTILLALVSTSIILFLAFFSANIAYFCKNTFLLALYNVSASGYAFPGTMLAVGVVVFIGYIDSFTGGLLFLSGSFVGIVFAYTVRFYAIPFGSIISGFTRIPKNLFDASSTLGHSKIQTSTRITLPLLKSSILAASILIFVDIVKELPMTLILRPFNFETLATYTYQFAHDELMIEASLPSLFIIISGLLPIILINRVMQDFHFHKN
jgi:iron(III) transport system permease protein